MYVVSSDLSSFFPLETELKSLTELVEAIEEGDHVLVDVVPGADADDEVEVRELVEVLHGELVAVVAPEVVEEEAHVGGVGQRVPAAVGEEEREARRDAGHLVHRRLRLPVAGDVQLRQHVVVLGQHAVAHGCRCRKGGRKKKRNGFTSPLR